MSTTTEQIKERLGIVEVVSGYIKLEKSGNNFVARCPFHHEKTPSFFVSPGRNTYYCFGCGEKGDVFSFVERFEGVPFKDSLRLLADKAGVEIVQESPEKVEARKTAYTLLEDTTKFFESNLRDKKDAIAYLKDRGLEDTYIESFRLGYVEDSWSSLYDYLKERGYADADIEKVGLAKKGDKGFYDRFRGRIMFPIADGTGRIIAFTGRIFPSNPDAAKYLNSPETVFFNKSSVLYGFNVAKFSIRKSNFSIVVEGQMDVLMAHQAGYTNTVALSGTSLTDLQVKQLKQLSNNIVFAFDSDKAGINSSGRSAQMALGAGMDVKVARMPEGKDPADMVQEDPESLKKAVRSSTHVINFYLDILGSSESDKRKLNRQVEEIVLPFVARIPSKIDQMHFVSEIARKLSLPEDVIRDEVIKRSADVKQQPESDTSEVATEKKVEGPSTRKDVIVNKLFGIIFSQKEMEEPNVDITEIEKSLTEIVGKDRVESLMKSPETFEEETLFLIEVGYENERQIKEDVTDLLRELIKECIQEAYEEALIKLREAEQANNQEEVEKYLSICKELSLTLSSNNT